MITLLDVPAHIQHPQGRPCLRAFQRKIPSYTVFVSGNDADAKQTVIGLLTSMGHTDVMDLGDITAARGTEMLLPVWLRLMFALGTAKFNFKIVR